MLLLLRQSACRKSNGVISKTKPDSGFEKNQKASLSLFVLPHLTERQKTKRDGKKPLLFYRPAWGCKKRAERNLRRKMQNKGFLYQVVLMKKLDNKLKKFVLQQIFKILCADCYQQTSPLGVPTYAFGYPKARQRLALAQFVNSATFFPSPYFSL